MDCSYTYKENKIIFIALGFSAQDSKGVPEAGHISTISLSRPMPQGTVIVLCSTFQPCIKKSKLIYFNEWQIQPTTPFSFI